jgi:bifunctional DNA-binding transcriptional regulator/antitoxin component of YhaV-PrlF toxin-antitoxin module
MGARKSEERAVRTVTQNNTGTYGITLPIGLMRALGWRKGQKVIVKRRGSKLLVEDWKE